MSKNNRIAYVFIRNEFAGTLTEIDSGYSFLYDNDYLNSSKPTAISLTLPLQHEEFISNTLFSFFDGLISEGWLLDVVVHNLKIDSKDRFGLLLATCNDCIGNVSIRRTRQ